MKIKKYMILYIDQDYTRVLNEADCRPEAPTGNVYHREKEEYQFKPYIGVLTTDDRTFAVPMTSAKPKHKNADIEDNILVSKYIDERKLKPTRNGKERILVDLQNDDPYFENHPEIKEEDKPYYKKWILNVCDIQKMIPVPNGTYERADFRNKPEDDPVARHRKNLLKDQYFGLESHKKEIEQLTSKMYDRQMHYNIVGSKEPDLANLEIASDIWTEYQENNYQNYKNEVYSDWMYNKKHNQTFDSFLKTNYHTDRLKGFLDYTKEHHNKKPKVDFERFLNDEYGVDNIKDAIEVFKQEESEWGHELE